MEKHAKEFLKTRPATPPPAPKIPKQHQMQKLMQIKSPRTQAQKQKAEPEQMKEGKKQRVQELQQPPHRKLSPSKSARINEYMQSIQNLEVCFTQAHTHTHRDIHSHAHVTQKVSSFTAADDKDWLTILSCTQACSCNRDRSRGRLSACARTHTHTRTHMQTTVALGVLIYFFSSGDHPE